MLVEQVPSGKMYAVQDYSGSPLCLTRPGFFLHTALGAFAKEIKLDKCNVISGFFLNFFE